MSGDDDSPIVSRFAQDPIYAPLLIEFVADLKVLVGELGSAVERGDYEAARSHGHKMRGAAATYGFAQLAETAGRVEDKIREATLREQSPDPAALKAFARQIASLTNRIERGLT